MPESGSGTITWTSSVHNDIRSPSTALLVTGMALNIPSFAVDIPPRRINLATINRMQLIDHQPEEMLRVYTFYSVLPRSDHVCAANYCSEEEKNAYNYLFRDVIQTKENFAECKVL